MLLTILKWAAIGIGAVIIVVTTTIITVRIVSKGNNPKGLAAISPAYAAKAEPLAAYDDIEQIRGQTADDPPAIFLMQVSLGYDTKDKEINVEIGNRRREIQDLILKDISQKKAADLAPGRYPEVQAELMDMINAVMRSGKVKSVMFRQFVVQK
jgi:flagellar FliL protein